MEEFPNGNLAVLIYGKKFKIYEKKSEGFDENENKNLLYRKKISICKLLIMKRY